MHLDTARLQSLIRVENLLRIGKRPDRPAAAWRTASMLRLTTSLEAPTQLALLREPVAARTDLHCRLQQLPLGACSKPCCKFNLSQSKVVSKAAFKALHKRYRTILPQGAKEVPGIPPRSKGQRGRVANSDAHNQHEWLVKHEESVLRFLRDAHASFTNNVGERAMRMPRSKSRSRAAFARKPTARPMPASPATSSRWPRSAIILSPPSKSRSSAKLPTLSSNTMARLYQRREKLPRAINSLAATGRPRSLPSSCLTASRSL